MIHAKTAVVDSRWCRVGSSNLNTASLLGNWEVDAGILDPDLAVQVEALFLADLASAVEIILPSAVRGHEAGKGMTELEEAPEFTRRIRSWSRASSGAQTLTLADLVRAGSSLGDAIAGHRVVGREDRALLAALSVALLTAALLAAVFPRTVAWTAAVMMGWMGSVLAMRGLLQFLKARQRVREEKRREEA